jgi:hypothetical protein
MRYHEIQEREGHTMSNIVIENDVVPAIIALDMDEINRQVMQDPNLKKNMEEMVDWLKNEYNRLNENNNSISK